MAIEFCTGNLLDSEAEALVNTVDTVGVMGKGIALQFKKAFPDMEPEYRKACESGALRPGKVHVYERKGVLHSQRYIVNFPTKRDWKHRSRIQDIEEGLKDLVRAIEEHQITSIAVPPLGCGNGRLDWEEVHPRIEHALSSLEGVRVLIYPPSGAPAPEKQVNRTKKPRMTPNRAALLGLLGRYRELDYPLTMIEIQKLAYFLQNAGQPLRLSFVKNRYGPYADDLRKVLRHLEGHYILGFGEGRNKPDTPISLLPEGLAEAKQVLREDSETIARFETVASLIEGYETPYGLELLSTVHWVATAEEPAARNPREALEKIRAWNPRKSDLMRAEHVEAAWRRLMPAGRQADEG